MPVSLELGGKSPSIVYPDADQDWSVDGIIAAMRFTRQSQSCPAGSRLFLHEDIFDPFLVKVHRRHPHGVLPVLASTLVKGSVGQCVWSWRGRPFPKPGLGKCWVLELPDIAKSLILLALPRGFEPVFQQTDARSAAGQTAFAPMRNNASNAAEAVNKAMSVYSIAMLRCPLFFERR